MQNSCKFIVYVERPIPTNILQKMKKLVKKKEEVDTGETCNRQV